MLAARVIRPDAFGSYALILVWLLLLGHASTLGTNQLVCRFLAAYRVQEDHGAALGLLRFALALPLAVSLSVAPIAMASCSLSSRACDLTS